jgi:histidinol-phosphate aminotransferase
MHPQFDAQLIFDELKKRRIFVRHWNKPRINQFLRISIGTPEEMKSLIAALEDIMKNCRKG